MIRLVVALPAEARPLIDGFGLIADPRARGFRVYRGRDCALVVSGMGQVAAAAATAYLAAALDDEADHPWVNVGIAGHADLPLGTPVLAHKVASRVGGDRWYPSLVVDWRGQTAPVCSVPRPSEGYRGAWLYDMEAAGFYPTACRFSCTELVHCLKVVSDNAAAPVREVTREQVVALMAGAVPALRCLLGALSDLATQVRAMTEPPAGFEDALERWHFTVSQQHQLRRALRRYRTATGAAPEWPPELRRAAGGEVLAWLQEAARRTPLRLVKERP